MNASNNRSICFILLILLAVVYLTDSTAAAQEPQWSLPQRVPGYSDESRAPHLVVDQNKTVHAFSQDGIGGIPAVMYRQWTLEQGWTDLIDVLVLPNKRPLELLGVYLDPEGIMHLVCFGGNELGADVYYAQAPAAGAGGAPSWSTPIVAGAEAKAPATGALAGDGMGNLFIIYSGGWEGTGLYAVYSTDGGASWSDPVAIFLTYSEILKPFAVFRYMDAEGYLHVTWTVVDDTGNGQAVYYTQLNLEENQLTWTVPTELAIAEGYEADWSSVVKHNGDLMVVYQNSSPATRWMTLSKDNGQTWSEPARPFPHVGEYGPAVFAVDNKNDLHMVLGNRIGNPATHGMWHSIWQGGGWRELIPIVSGEAVKPDPLGDTRDGFDPHFPKAVVSQGNLILAAWSNDHGFNGVWYSYMIVDAPELPVVPLPTVPHVPSPTPTPRPTLAPAAVPAIPTPALLHLVSDEGDTSTDQPVANPSLSLVIGFMPALLLIVVVSAIRIVRRSTNY